MQRRLTAFGWLLLAACAGEDDGAPAIPDAVTLVEGEAGQPFVPSFSPDGRRLAWTVPVDGQGAIFVGNADGSGAIRLTHGIWDSFPVWSPNGQWIAYHAEAPDFDIFIVPSDGSAEPRSLTSGSGFDLPWYWLPDNSGVVFVREGLGPDRTLVAPIDGGPVQPLVPDDTGNRFVALSPDGTRAVVGVERGGNNTILLMTVESAESAQLTNEGFETISRFPWSPDGSRVLYESRRTGTADIWLADVETGELRQITTDIHNDDNARWSPDGRWVLFRSDRGGQTDLWVVSAEGGQPVRVTDDIQFEEGHDWTPDGTGVYFVSLSREERLQLLPLDGGEPRELVSWPGYSFAAVDLSPDSSTVVFQSTRSGNLDLWSIPLEGGEPVPLTTSPLADELPQFSPDGSTIVFHSHRGGTGDLWLMPAAGGEATQLTDWPSIETGPRWSPDGSMIAFASNRDADREELWVLPVEGGEARRLTADLGNVDAVRWAPDGTAIYFIGSAESGARELYRVTLEGGQPQPLGASPYIGVGDLSPDGEHYAYSAFEAGWAFIEVIPTAGGQPRRLTTRTDRVYHPNVLWAPDGNSLVVMDYVYPEDTIDLMIVSWPDGEWRALTNTPRTSEFFQEFTPDDGLLVVSATQKNTIRSVRVAELLAGSGAR